MENGYNENVVEAILDPDIKLGIYLGVNNQLIPIQTKGAYEKMQEDSEKGIEYNKIPSYNGGEYSPFYG